MNAPPLQYATTSDGLSIAYCESGKGRTFLGMPGILSDFSKQWAVPTFGMIYANVAERWRFVQYDSRGQGMSSRGLAEGLSIGDYVGDLESVVARLSLNDFVLFAPSAFGQIGIAYAAAHPDLVRALILHNYFDYSYGVPFGDAEGDWQKFLNVMTRFGYAGFELDAVSRFIQTAATQADYLKQRQVLRDSSVEDLLGQIKMPTLILTERATAGGVDREPLVRRIAAQMPDASVVFYDYLPFPASDGRLAQLIDAFLARIDGVPVAAGRTFSSTSGLSAREVEVLRLIVVGKSNQQIADQLVISFNTVQRHVSHILSKAGVANRTEAAVYAREQGLA